MEQFPQEVIRTVFSQAGAVGGLLILAVLYLVRELGKEKKEHAETRKQLFDLSDKSITSSVTSTEVMSGMRAVLNSIQTTIDLALRGRGGR